jgi:hypothetical protein
LISLIRAFFILRIITFFACTSFCFIRQNFMNWTSTRFFSSFFFFCNFAMMIYFTFFLMSFKLFVSNRKRLRKNFFYLIFFISSFITFAVLFLWKMNW